MKKRTDFVTNSSSSSFICNTKKTVNQIEEELKELLAIYNKITEQNISFDSAFMIYESRKGIIIDSADDNSIPYSFWDMIEQGYDAERRFNG